MRGLPGGGHFYINRRNMKSKHLVLAALVLWVPIALFITCQSQRKPFKTDIAAEISQLIDSAKGGRELENALLEVEALKITTTDATDKFWLQSNGHRHPDFIQFSNGELMKAASYLVFSAPVKPSEYRIFKHTLRGTVLIGGDNQVVAYQTYTKHDWF